MRRSGATTSHARCARCDNSLEFRGLFGALGSGGVPGPVNHRDASRLSAMPSLRVRFKGGVTKVSIRPMGTLGEILGQVCKKKGLDPSNWALKHRNMGVLTLSTPFTMSRVDNNATVELVPRSSAQGGGSRRRGAPVRVAVAFPSGRVQGAFTAERSLWDILVELDGKGKGVWRPGQPENTPFMMPRVTVVSLRRDFGTLDELTGTTLGSLGIRGSCLMRVSFTERSDVTLDQAMAAVRLSRGAAKAPKEGGTSAPSTPVSPPRSKSAATIDAPSTKTSTKPSSMSSTPVSGSNPNRRAAQRPELDLATVQRSIAALQREASGPETVVALQTVRKIVSNILTKSGDRYRTVNMSLTKLYTLLGKWKSSGGIMTSLGFRAYQKADGLYLVLAPENEDRDFLRRALDIIAEDIVLATPATVTARPSESPSRATPAGSIAAGSIAAGSIEAKKEELSFDWEEERARRKAEADAAKGKDEKQPPDLLERTRVVEPMSFDWERERERDGDGVASENVSVEARMDVVQPEYRLADVRESLSRLRKNAPDAKACLRSMRVLRGITKKLIDAPGQAQYRRIKLTNKAVRARIAAFPGALDYLSFLGFTRSQDGELLVLPPKSELKVKTQRALSVLSRVYAEIEATVPLFDEKQRALKVFDVSNVDERSFDLLAGRAPGAKSDAQLVAQSVRDAKLRKQLENKILEREKLRRRYDRTVIRVVFRGHGIIIQAHFSPKERTLHLFKAIKSLLCDSSTSFSLRLPPNTDITERDALKTLDELRLVPAATLNFVAKQGGSAAEVLRAEVISRKEPLAAEPVPRAVNEQEIQDNIEKILPGRGQKKGAAGLLAAARRGRKKRAAKKPKWMRLAEELGE